MKISDVLTLMLDPRIELQDIAVRAIARDWRLFNRCQFFVNTMTSEFNGYTTDEIRLKWERRIVAPYMQRIAGSYASDLAVVTDDAFDYYLCYKGHTVGGPYRTTPEVTAAKKRFLTGIVCGLDPGSIL